VRLVAPLVTVDNNVREELNQKQRVNSNLNKNPSGYVPGCLGDINLPDNDAKNIADAHNIYT
tara:strand:- start:35 stop:220 length:186 start_codon:yes stop_codon:yes gene_type:complete